MKRGIALQGGGAKGAYQIGILKTLFARGYRFDGAVGTSIGSLNAAMVAQDDFELALSLWENISISQILDVDEQQLEKLTSFNFDKESLLYGWNYLKKVLANKGIDTDKMIDFVKKYLNEQRIRESEIDFGLVTYRVDTKQTIRLMKKDIPEGELILYVMASANYPLFERIEIGDATFMDGGVKDNLPINLLIDNGYTEIFAISLGDSICPIEPPKDESVKVVYFYPVDDLGSTLAFSAENSKKLIRLGEYDALRYTDNVAGIKYYFSDLDGFILSEWLLSLPESFFRMVISEYDLQSYISKEQALVVLTNFLATQLNTSNDIQIAWLTLLETFAEYLGVERFKIYKLESFIDELMKKSKSNKIELKSSILKVITLRKAKEKRALQVFVWLLDAIKGQTAG